MFDFLIDANTSSSNSILWLNSDICLTQKFPQLGVKILIRITVTVVPRRLCGHIATLNRNAHLLTEEKTKPFGHSKTVYF